MTPKIRSDAFYDIQSSLIYALEKATKENGLLRSCINCIHFNEQNESCKLANGLKPPARIIAYGCVKWECHDEIPF